MATAAAERGVRGARLRFRGRCPLDSSGRIVGALKGVETKVIPERTRIAPRPAIRDAVRPR
jgi:hypothetical protein